MRFLAMFVHRAVCWTSFPRIPCEDRREFGSFHTDPQKVYLDPIDPQLTWKIMAIVNQPPPNVPPPEVAGLMIRAY